MDALFNVRECHHEITEFLHSTYVVSPASSNRIRSFPRPSRPVFKSSSDRPMCPSCVVCSRFSEMARCRSRSESFMWSARRLSCLGFDMINGSACTCEFLNCIRRKGNVFLFVPWLVTTRRLFKGRRLGLEPGCHQPCHSTT